jgi:hypothetical protein
VRKPLRVANRQEKLRLAITRRTPISPTQYPWASAWPRIGVVSSAASGPAQESALCDRGGSLHVRFRDRSKKRGTVACRVEPQPYWLSQISVRHWSAGGERMAQWRSLSARVFWERGDDCHRSWCWIAMARNPERSQGTGVGGSVCESNAPTPAISRQSAGFEVEPSCGRERSGSPQAQSRAQRGN